MKQREDQLLTRLFRAGATTMATREQTAELSPAACTRIAARCLDVDDAALLEVRLWNGLAWRAAVVSLAAALFFASLTMLWTNHAYATPKPDVLPLDGLELLLTNR